MNELKEKYNRLSKKELLESLNLTNVNQVPKIIKVIINSGVGRAVSDSKQLDFVVESLTKISGQKPLATKARRSIAGFKLREGNQIGAKVTLRGDRMYYFLNRLVRVVIPRMRHFRGLPSSGFDLAGNYNIGIKEHTVFPEIPQEDVNITHGLQIQIVTTAKDKNQGIKLLKSLGFPMERSNNG
ncbi:MAG: 50S ribosomal protein L5 [bacterium]|nr:50S ribosomal protein L5 [bacterium]